MATQTKTTLPPNVPPPAPSAGAPMTSPPNPSKQKAGRTILGWNVASCAFYAFVPVLLLLLGFLFFIAKTGIVYIPCFSDWYKGPQPTRMVEVPPANSSALIENIGLRVAEAIHTKEAPPYRVSLTEEQMSAALRGSIAEALQERSIVVERPQIVVTSSTLEVSGVIRLGLGMMDILMRFLPDVHEDGVHLHVEEAYLGDIPLNPELVKTIEGTVFHRNLRSWQIGVGEHTLVGVELHNGSIDLILTPKIGE